MEKVWEDETPVVHFTTGVKVKLALWTLGWTALWWEEFDGSELNSEYWAYDIGNGDWGWGNGEQEYYTNSPDNVAVRDGQLSMTALNQETNGFSYTSGRLNTQGLVGFCPGVADSEGNTYSTVRLETSIKAPAPGQGLWPALWLSPADLTYGAWPASGEIDMYEMINTMNRATQGLHYGGEGNHVRNTWYTAAAKGTTFADGFNTYAIEWSATSISFSINGEVTESRQSKSVAADGWYSSASNATPNAPFDIPFFIIVNLALGGNWAGQVNSSTPFPSTLLVDYVRILGTNT